MSRASYVTYADLRSRCARSSLVGGVKKALMCKLNAFTPIPDSSASSISVCAQRNVSTHHEKVQV